MKFFSKGLMIIITISAMSSSASAGELKGWIQKIDIDENSDVVVELPIQTAAGSACAKNARQFGFNASSPLGKNWLSLLVVAANQKKNVTAKTSDTCIGDNARLKALTIDF